MAGEVHYATGKRKTAVARVWLKPGKGEHKVNQRSIDDYFNDPYADKTIGHPFKVTDTTDQYDIYATLRGGGKSAQTEALRHGVARALLNVNPEFRLILKRAGLLTRDPRAKERKKYGQKGARAKFQFSKR